MEVREDTRIGTYTCSQIVDIVVVVVVVVIVVIVVIVATWLRKAYFPIKAVYMERRDVRVFLHNLHFFVLRLCLWDDCYRYHRNQLTAKHSAAVDVDSTSPRRIYPSM